MVGPATKETYIWVPRPVASEERWKAARWEGVREGRRGISAELAPTARVAWVRSDRPITFPTSAFTAAMAVSLEDFHFELNEYWYRKMLSSSRTLLQDLLRLVCVVLSVGTHALTFVAKLALFLETSLIVLVK